MTKTVELRFCSSRYTRRTKKVVTVSYDALPRVVACYLWGALEEFASRTWLEEVNLTMWDSLGPALPGLADVFSWHGFIEIPISELETEDVRDLFMDIDDTFHRAWGSDRGALRSSRIRKFILSHLLDVRQDGRLARVKGSFSPKGRADHNPRPLISDQVAILNGQAIQAPVGALPHSNPQHLKAEVLRRLEADLYQISQACLSELLAYDGACATLARIRDAPVDRVAERRALEKVTLNKPHLRARSELLSERERAALAAHYFRQDDLPSASFAHPGYKGSSLLGEWASRAMGISPDSFLRCARYRYYPHPEVIVAAIVQIQIATRWNVSSVMELTSNHVAYQEGQYYIQSIKSRTADDTPPVLVDAEDAATIKALDFLLERLRALKSRGYAPCNEVHLWLGQRSNYDCARGLCIGSPTTGLTKLIKTHSLPKFSFEQIRTQTLTVLNLKKGPIAAAEAAGHSNFGSIAGYIDHLVTRRLNSAINLEFQKRWEAEVAARLEGKEHRHPLVPIGDGASCVNPNSPPEDAWLEAGVCDGTHCHVGSGCPNRALIIDTDRVEEVILTRRYYDTNWQRLYSGNPDAFAEIHVPRIEFNTYLYQYLKTGPYRHLLNDEA